MRVALLGASGFLGQRLIAALRGRGDAVVTGSVRAGTVPAAARRCAGAEVVVNLAGAAVAQRWTAATKAEMRGSRVDRTRELVAELAKLSPGERPRAYVVSSAIGYYGTSESQTFTEESGPGSDFLAEICVALEREAERMRELGMRLAVLRIGVVLGAEGGMLKALMPVYRMGLGGPVASGRQWVSWIHVEDQVELFLKAIDGAEGSAERDGSGAGAAGGVREGAGMGDAAAGGAAYAGVCGGVSAGRGRDCGDGGAARAAEADARGGV